MSEGETTAKHDAVPDESELISRVQAGEDAAFEALVARYQRPVIDFLYRLCGQAADADDMAQEVFVRVYRHIGAFHYRPDIARFSTWLFQIARNVAIDHSRSRARRPESAMDVEAIARLPSVATAATAAAALSANEVGACVAAAVAGLPEDQRMAVILSEYEGQTDAAIAEVMQCSRKAVESLLYRARKSLRQSLAALM